MTMDRMEGCSPRGEGAHERGRGGRCGDGGRRGHRRSHTGGIEAIAAMIASSLGGRHRGGSWSFGGRGGGHGGDGGGMRRRKMFDGAELRLVLLKLIGDEPRHGYDLIKSIEELAGGGYAPSPGTVYPSLTMLNEIRHVSSADTGDGRRKFTITADGQAHLTEQAETVTALIARLSSMGDEHKRTDGTPVRRAMGNLATALRGRLSRGDATDAMLHDMAAMIDELAQKIERVA